MGSGELWGVIGSKFLSNGVGFDAFGEGGIMLIGLKKLVLIQKT